MSKRVFSRVRDEEWVDRGPADALIDVEGMTDEDICVVLCRLSAMCGAYDVEYEIRNKYLIGAMGRNLMPLEEFWQSDDETAKIHWRILMKERMPQQAALFRVDDLKKTLHFIESARRA